MTYAAGTAANACAIPLDLTAGATATFDFATTYMNTMAKCIQVKVGQTVNFTGVGGIHPMSPQDCGPTPVITTTKNANFSTTFGTAGNYGVHCEFHGSATGGGMALQIKVVP